MLWIFLGVLFVGIIVGMPISFAIGLSAVVMMLASGENPALLVEQATNGVNSFPLLAIPFFVLVGEIMSRGGIANRLVEFAQALVGFMAGGLGQVNVAASMFFGGISGSAVADASAIGGIMIPPMKTQGYMAGHATAITVSAAVIGIIVPPSIPMILYGIVTGTSITALFIAGIVPGILIGVALMIATYLTSRRTTGGAGRQKFSGIALARSFKSAWLALLLPVIIIGGILGGVFTATEAAVVAVVYSLVISLFVYKELRLRDLWPILIRTGRLSGMVLFLLAMATPVAIVLTKSMVPQSLVAAASDFSTNPYVMLTIMSVMLLLVGVVMDLTPAMVILAPIMAPIVIAVGVDPVYFGVIMSLVLGIGLITPPVGTVLYVGCAVGKVSMEDLLRNMPPFYLAMLGVLVLLIALPQLVLFLPSVAG